MHLNTGACAIRAGMMALCDGWSGTYIQLPWRSLQDIQELAIAGKRGKQPGDLKPFNKLKVQEIKEELYARGYYKKDLEETLKDTLKGVQRVPTLLLLNPTAGIAHG